jgi:hypothetical protein
MSITGFANEVDSFVDTIVRSVWELLEDGQLSRFSGSVLIW